MPAGRPPKFRNAKKLQEKIDAYFAKCKRDKEPLTITGLTMALGFLSRQSLLDYAERNEGKEQYADIIKKAKLRVEHSYELKTNSPNPGGAIFVLKNFGWKDRQEVKHTLEGQGRIFTDLELAARLSYLIELAMRRKREQEAIEGQKVPELPDKSGEK
jgi:hypothetical protein